MANLLSMKSNASVTSLLSSLGALLAFDPHHSLASALDASTRDRKALQAACNTLVTAGGPRALDLQGSEAAALVLSVLGLPATPAPQAPAAPRPRTSDDLDLEADEVETGRLLMAADDLCAGRWQAHGERAVRVLLPALEAMLRLRQGSRPARLLWLLDLGRLSERARVELMVWRSEVGAIDVVAADTSRADVCACLDAVEHLRSIADRMLDIAADLDPVIYRRMQRAKAAV
jgi:hypothetical protein